MEFILSAIALLILVSSGLGLLLLFRSREAEIDLLEAGSLSFLLGCLAVSGSSFLLGVFLSGMSLRVAVSLTGILLLAAGIARSRGLGMKVKRAVPAGSHDLLLLLLMVAQTGFVFWFSAHTGLGWDGIFHWEIKARLIFENHGVLPISYLTDPALWSSHRGYPLLLPLTEAWFYGWIGSAHQGMIKLLFPFFFLSGFALLATATGRRSIVAPLLLSFVPLVQFGDGGVPAGYADFPLAVYYLACVVGILRLGSSEDSGYGVLGLLLAALPWLKQDGNVLFAVLLLILAFKLWDGRKGLWPYCRQIALIGLPGVLVVIGWGSFVREYKTPVEQFYLSPLPSTLFGNLGRLPVILSWIGSELINWRHWGLLWPAILAAAAGILVRSWKKGLVLVSAVGLPILVYGFIYFFVATDRISLDEWLFTSLSRLMLHVVPTGLLLVAWSYREEISGIWNAKSVD